MSFVSLPPDLFSFRRIEDESKGRWKNSSGGNSPLDRTFNSYERSIWEKVFRAEDACNIECIRSERMNGNES